MKQAVPQCPIGAYGSEIAPGLRRVVAAAGRILKRLYAVPSPRKSALSPRERNIIIRARYAAGGSQADLSREFGISYQRIHQIVHQRRK